MAHSISYKRKPDWLRVKIQGSSTSQDVEAMVEGLSLHTVCVEANCPNRMECFNRKTATFMILGRHCTRNCAFCNVTHSEPTPVDVDEPDKVADAVVKLGLRHAVITSVTRDDLPDGGASHFASVVRAIRQRAPGVAVELLIPDLQGSRSALKTVMDSKPDVLNHNVETVPELYSAVRPQADFRQSVELLRQCKEMDPQIKTKSGIMLGLGETHEQIVFVLNALQEAKVDLLTIGQYLQPSEAHYPVQEYVTPEAFESLKKLALEMGFEGVASSPLVRSSYHADELAGNVIAEGTEITE